MEKIKIKIFLSIFFVCSFWILGAGNAIAGTITIDSYPVSGAYVTIELPAQDLDGKGSGFGPITRRYNSGTNVVFHVSTSYSGGNFVKWTKDGDDYYFEPSTVFTVDSSSHTFLAHYTTPPPFPDFVVTSIILNPSTPITGYEFAADVTVMNQGEAAGVPGHLDVYVNQPSSMLCKTLGDQSIYVETLGIGESRTYTFTQFFAGAPGQNTFRAVIDSYCETAEMDNNNNESTLTYTVLPIQKPDFVVTTIVLEPGSPVAGSTFTATVTVKNQGAVSGDGGRLSLWRDQASNQGCGVSGEQFGNIGVLAAGESKVFTFTGFQGGSAGSKTFRVFVDSLCQTTEVSEDNNQSTKGYTVGEAPKPDFVVTSIVINPASPTSGDTFSADVTVKNQGTASGDGGRMDVWVNQPSAQSCGSTGDYYVNVGALASGVSKTFTFTPWTGAAGSKTFRAFVDSGCVTTETDDTNNQLTKAYTVGEAPKPDFLVTSIVINPASPTSGSTFTADVTVKNQGPGSGNGGILEVWANQASSQGCGSIGDKFTSVGTLASSESKTFTFTGLSTGAAGSKTFRAFVDSGCVTTETDDTNNQMTKAYTVVAAPSMELVLYRVSDTSGTLHTSNPGVAQSSFSQGQTVRVTVQARNNGPSGVGANWVLNLAPNANHGNVRYNSDPAQNNTNDKTIPNDGQWQYYSFDWAITSGDPTGAYDLLGAVRSSSDWNQVLDDTQDGANTSGLGPSAWKSAFSVTVAKGNLDIYVKTQSGSYQSGVSVLRYYTSWGNPIDTKVTDASGKASWSGIDVGTYHFEAYYPSVVVTGVSEFWGNKLNLAVNAGSNPSVTIQRFMPYALSIETRDSNNQPKTQFNVGETVKIVTKVKNASTAVWNTKVQMQADQDKSGSMDFDQTTGYASVGVGATQEFTGSYTPSGAGTYYIRPRQVMIQGTGGDQLTDSWLWPNITFTVVKNVFIADYHLNKIPSVTSTVEASTQPLLFPDPVFDPGKFGAIVRVFNPTSEIFNGFLEISQYVTPSGSVVNDSTPGWGTDRISVNSISPQSFKDVFVPLLHNEPGNWNATISLEIGVVLTGVTVLDKVSFDYQVYAFGEPTLTCEAEKPLWQQIGGKNWVYSPTAASDQDLLYGVALLDLKVLLELLRGIYGGIEYGDPIGAPGADFFLEDVGRDLQTTAFFSIWPFVDRNSGTLSFQWWNKISSRYNMCFPYDRAVIKLNLPDTVRVIDTGNGLIVHNPKDRENIIYWIINGIDKQITCLTNNYSWQNHTISLKIDDTTVTEAYDLNIELFLQIGPFQGVLGTDYDILEDLPAIYNYAKWCSNPEEMYWYVIAAKKLSTTINPVLSLSYIQPPTLNKAVVGETETISVKVKNTGSVPIPNLWLGMDIRNSSGRKVESTKTGVVDPETGKLGLLDFGYGTIQGQTLNVGEERLFTVSYSFTASGTGDAYAAGNYTYNYCAWSGVPGASGSVPIGSAPPPLGLTLIPSVAPIKLNVPYYSQYDAGWCAAASLSMLMKYYGVERKVWDIAADLKWKKEQGFVPLYELNNHYFENYCASFGLDLVREGPFWWNLDHFINYLKEKLSFGKPLMVCSSFTNEGLDEGHCIAITGLDEDNVYINDPSGAFLEALKFKNNDCKYDNNNWSDRISRPVFWSCFNSKFDSLNWVYTYYINSNINSHKEKSVFPAWPSLQFFSNNNKNNSPIIWLDFDGETHTSGYYWKTDQPDYFPYDYILDNKVTTSEDFTWFAVIANPSRKSTNLNVLVEIGNLEIAQTYYEKEYSIAIDENENFVLMNGIIDLSPLVSGNYVFYVTVYDNGSYVDSYSLKFNVEQVDNQPPSKPQNLITIPNGWANVNNFELYWSNPEDDSGVQAAWYKLDSPPNSPPDGIRIDGSGIFLLNNIKTTSEGGQNIYVWLEDGAGNKDHNNYEMVTLYFDGTAPNDGNLIAQPGDRQISLSWNGFSDAGGSDLRSTNTYKVVRNIGTYPNEQCTNGIPVYLGNGNSVTDIGLINGTNYFYRVCAYDNAGNVSQGAKASAAPICPPLGAPTLISPSGTGISTTPTLDWSDVSGFTSYEAQVCSDSECNTVVRQQGALPSSQWVVSPALTQGTQYWWRARASNVCGSGAWPTSFLSFTTVSSPTITTNSPLPSGTVSSAYSQTLQAMGGSTPYGWSIASGGLPPGLSLTSSTGFISGTPTIVNTYNFRIRVTGSNSLYSEKDFSLTINSVETAPPAPPHNLRIVAGGKGIRLVWDPNQEEDLAGYNLYYGLSPWSFGEPIKVGKKNSYILKNLVKGQRYYIAFTAYDWSKHESFFSNQVYGFAHDAIYSTWIFDISGEDKGGCFIFFDDSNNTFQGYGVSEIFGQFRIDGSYEIDEDENIVGTFSFYEFNNTGMMLETVRMMGVVDSKYSKVTFNTDSSDGSSISLAFKGLWKDTEEIFQNLGLPGKWTAKITGETKGALDSFEIKPFQLNGDFYPHLFMISGNRFVGDGAVWVEGVFFLTGKDMVYGIYWIINGISETGFFSGKLKPTSENFNFKFVSDNGNKYTFKGEVNP